MIKEKRVRDIILLMSRDWKNLLLIITFDILFMLVLSSLRFVQISVDSTLLSLFTTKRASLIYSITYVIFEFLLIISVYSFFKFLIIKFISESFDKANFRLKDFFSFLKINFVIFIPLIVMFAIVLDLILMFFNSWLSRGGIDPFKFVFVILTMGVLALVLFIFFYTFINKVHFAFLKEQRFGKLLKKGIIGSFRIDSYGMYWSNLKIIFVSGVFLLIIHFFIKSFIFDDFSSYVSNVGIYKVLVYWVIALVLYFLLLINRFNFCAGELNFHKREG